MLNEDFLKTSYEQFLLQLGILPINTEKGIWKKPLLIDHTVENAPKKAREHSKVRKFIRTNVMADSGIYVYFTSNNKVLYVGESQDLKGRLSLHYDESYKPCTDLQYQRWHDLFGAYREVLTLWYLECENLHDRKAIEAMLTRVLKPIYNE